MERKQWLQASRLGLFRLFYDSHIGYPDRTILLEASRRSHRNRLKQKEIMLLEHLKGQK